MSQVDERIELLISRQLDGELGEDEQLELNRELVRNPEARRMLEACGRLDILARDAMASVLGRESMKARQRASLRFAPRGTRGQWRVKWLAPGAAAAAVLALALTQFAARSPNPETNGGMTTGNRIRLESPQELGRMVSYSGDAKPRIDRKTNRNVYGVVGDDGNVYWIEVDYVRTLSKPSKQTSEQLLTGGM